MASNLPAMASNLLAIGLQPTSDGQPSIWLPNLLAMASNLYTSELQPTSGGLQPTSDGLQPTTRYDLQPT